VKIALVIPKGFFTKPEFYGGGIVRAYKVYEHLGNINPLELYLLDYHADIPLYLASLIKNVVKTIFSKPDVIVSSCEGELSAFLAEISGIISGKPIAIVFNAVPLTGWVGSGLCSDFRWAFKHLLRKSWKSHEKMRARLYYGARSMAKILLALTTLRIAKYMKRRIMAIAITPHVGDELRRLGLNVVEVYPGNAFDMLDVDGSISKVYDACYVANPLCEEKGLLDVLYAWRLVVKEIPAARLVMVGRVEKGYLERIKELVNKLGLDESVTLYVSYSGLPRREVIRLLTHCKVFVYPTRKDVWPLVIGEALSVGLPVVAYGLPNVRYAYGWCPAVKLVEIGDVVGFAKEVVKILEDDEKATSDVSSIARECARKITWKRVALLEARAIMEVMKLHHI
jgi:glycosyltransferase involved in cell wall biosynthesis